jgi:hypothetical protein
MSGLSPECAPKRTSAAISVSTVSKKAGDKTVLESEAAKTVRLVRIEAARLSWRPLLSVLCRRIYYTAVDRFCAPVVPAAQLKDYRSHCTPDIFSQSISLAGVPQTAFSIATFQKRRPSAGV